MFPDIYPSSTTYQMPRSICAINKVWSCQFTKRYGLLKHTKKKKIERPCHALLECTARVHPSFFHIICRKFLNEISFESQYSRMPGNFQPCALFATCCPQIPLPVLSCGQEKPAQDNPSHKGRSAGGWLDPRAVQSWIHLNLSWNYLKWGHLVWASWIQLSGQRWPGLESKLSHLSTDVKHLGRIIHSPPLSMQQNLQPRPRLCTSF